ncbi:hypothetical protein BN1044_03819 [Hafnia alvei]|uniref:Uncharacterized protein n=1 Tax=Hafnia alvei TaxID=569 RepID=A0A1C6Z5C8_HAFAL|nr:hypothetical protein BN1044_03819 [Hafnia alvei]
MRYPFFFILMLALVVFFYEYLVSRLILLFINLSGNCD